MIDLADIQPRGRLASERFAPLAEEISLLKKRLNAVILAHDYVICRKCGCGGFFGDSLGLAQEAARQNADVIVFSAASISWPKLPKILNPHKIVVLRIAMQAVHWRKAACPAARGLASHESQLLDDRLHRLQCGGQGAVRCHRDQRQCGADRPRRPAVKIFCSCPTRTSGSG